MRNIKCIYAHGNSSSTSGSSHRLFLVPRSETGTPESPDPKIPNIANTFGLQITPRPQFAPTSLSTVDLRLMHHFVTVSSSAIFSMDRPGIERIILFQVPRLAFQH